ncbi:MAG: hypothetical protein ACOYIT_04415 [Christensenellales bacterium]|jgi:hypothetical protein
MKKKLVALLLLTFTLMTCATALAITFTLNAQCVNTTSYVRSLPSDPKQVCDHKIMVYHNSLTGSNAYNNHFRGYNYESDYLINSKWVTPGGRYFIEGTGFAEDWRYYLTMRGNTKYHEKEGLDNVVLQGWFLVH